VHCNRRALHTQGLHASKAPLLPPQTAPHTPYPSLQPNSTCSGSHVRRFELQNVAPREGDRGQACRGQVQELSCTPPPAPPPQRRHAQASPRPLPNFLGRPCPPPTASAGLSPHPPAGHLSQGLHPADVQAGAGALGESRLCPRGGIPLARTPQCLHQVHPTVSALVVGSFRRAQDAAALDVAQGRDVLL